MMALLKAKGPSPIGPLAKIDGITAVVSICLTEFSPSKSEAIVVATEANVTTTLTRQYRLDRPRPAFLTETTAHAIAAISQTNNKTTQRQPNSNR
jgi:hypothetical protein